MRDGKLVSKNSVIFYLVGLGVVIVDQITKIIARNSLSDRALNVIPGFFDLRLSYNRGAAFGVLPDWTPLFIIVALVAIFAIVKLRSAGPDSRSLSIGLGLLLGGALGNLIDRLISPGNKVTDFLSVHIASKGKTYAWPTFNIADMAIVIGAVIVLFYVYIIEKRRSENDAG